ncbi:hypothetical protein TNCV_3399561 [Trichonephila clavipes]|nr:hypothetical protein TNCV_3399561 [Trichonephila clavipes]
MSQEADGGKTRKCWTCVSRRASARESCRARQGAETNKSAFQKEVSGRLIVGPYSAGGGCRDFWKAPTFISVSAFPTRVPVENGVFIMGRVSELPAT